jgi:hypothetical protein
MNLEKICKKYSSCLTEAESLAEEVIEAVCKMLQPLIGDIEGEIGWEEGGVDTLCFYSESHSILNRSNPDLISFEEVLESVFPDLEGHVFCPLGIYLTEKEAEAVKKLLKRGVSNGKKDQNKA